MFMVNILKYKNELLTMFGYMIVSFLSGLILRNGLVLFLTFNMFLALVSFLIAILINILKDKNVSKNMLIVSTFIWVLFYPNALYITTDLIHLQAYDFFNSYPDVYTYMIYDWYVFAIILIGVLISGKTSITNLNIIKNIYKFEGYKFHINLFLIFSLSSIGIYIGRFIRLNSWDFYRLDLIFIHMFEQMSFFIGFVIVLIIIHYAFYLLFNQNSNSQ